MGTKTNLGLLGLAAFAIFLIVRGGGQLLSGLKFPDFKLFGDITFPSITTQIESTYPNISDQGADVLKDISGKLQNLVDKPTLTANEILNAFKGLDPLGTPANPADNPTAPTPTDVILNDPNLQAGEKDRLLNILGVTQQGYFTDLFKYNPPNIIGYGVLGDYKKGIPRSLAETFGIQSGETLEDLSIAELTKLADYSITGRIPDPKDYVKPEDRKVNEAFVTEEDDQIINYKVPPVIGAGIISFNQVGGQFVGGAIYETPIANLSLSQIIDKFGVSASQAADIRARSRNDFGDFDFGSNTGSGIGSVFQNQNLNSQLPAGNVSDQRFAGKSAQEIANLLTGGNINNWA